VLTFKYWNIQKITTFFENIREFSYLSTFSSADRKPKSLIIMVNIRGGWCGEEMTFRVTLYIFKLHHHRLRLLSYTHMVYL